MGENRQVVLHCTDRRCFGERGETTRVRLRRVRKTSEIPVADGQVTLMRAIAMRGEVASLDAGVGSTPAAAGRRDRDDAPSLPQEPVSCAVSAGEPNCTGVSICTLTWLNGITQSCALQTSTASLFIRRRTPK